MPDDRRKVRVAMTMDQLWSLRNVAHEQVEEHRKLAKKYEQRHGTKKEWEGIRYWSDIATLLGLAYGKRKGK